MYILKKLAQIQSAREKHLIGFEVDTLLKGVIFVPICYYETQYTSLIQAASRFLIKHYINPILFPSRLV